MDSNSSALEQELPGASCHKCEARDRIYPHPTPRLPFQPDSHRTSEGLPFGGMDTSSPRSSLAHRDPARARVETPS